MHRQVCDLVLDGGGVAVRGRVMRPSVLRGGLAGMREVVRFVTENLSRRI